MRKNKKNSSFKNYLLKIIGTKNIDENFARLMTLLYLISVVYFMGVLAVYRDREIVRLNQTALLLLNCYAVLALSRKEKC